MKALIPITIIFIAVNLAIAGSASVPIRDGQAIEDTYQAETVLAQRQAELAVITAQREADLAAADARKQTDMALRQARYSLALPDVRGIAESATGGLLVLTSQLKAEDLAAMVEDLNVMSRILDKKVGRAQDSRIRIFGDYLGLDNLLSGSHRSTAQSQAMYVQGYAAMFFLNVDFPLSPPPEVQVQKVKAGADPVWEQIKREIAPSDKDLGLAYTHQRDAVARQYDKEKVEELKTDLVKALKHAANIRNLKPDEWAILVVAGTEPALVVAEHGDEPHRYQWILSKTQPPMLTIRAKKTDIDAFAKSQLDYGQFRQRSQILTAQATSGPRGLERTLSIIK